MLLPGAGSGLFCCHSLGPASLLLLPADITPAAAAGLLATAAGTALTGWLLSAADCTVPCCGCQLLGSTLLLQGATKAFLLAGAAAAVLTVDCPV